MKNKFFLAISALMVTAALLLSVTAQIKTNILGTPVKLQCKIGTPVEFPTVTVTNNTSETVPAGKKIYWQGNSLMKGVILLSAPLAPGQSVKTSAEAAGTSYSPAAWYFK